MKYLLKKIPYFIQDYPNANRFLFFETIFLGRSKTCPMSERTITKMKGICVTYLYQSFTKCVYNWYILWCIDIPVVTASYEMPFNLIFDCFFSSIIDEHSFLKYFIFIQHSQIVCIINIHILVCQHAKYDCRLWKVLWFNCIIWKFSNIFTCLKRLSFVKLRQNYRLYVETDV